MNKRHRKLAKVHQLHVWVGYNQGFARWEQLTEFSAIARDKTHLMEILWAQYLNAGETLYNLSDDRIARIMGNNCELDLPIPNNWMHVFEKIAPNESTPEWYVEKVGVALPDQSPCILTTNFNHG
jgi:hypothetical protein